MKHLLKSTIKKTLKAFGFEVTRVQHPETHFFDHTFQRLKVLQKLGFQPNIICDIGASSGSWSRQCLEIFSNAQYFCVDPLEENLADLTRLSAEYPNVKYWQGCLGAKSGTATLNVERDGSSILRGHWGNPYGIQREVKVETLDHLIELRVCEQPDLIKLDVQGYELKVLKGATRALQKVQAIIAEVSFFSFQEGMPVFHEVVKQLSDFGFVVSDILSLSVRPLDNSAAQTDLLFLRETHPLRQDNRWDHNSIY